MRQRRFLSLDSGRPPDVPVVGTVLPDGARVALSLFTRAECHLCDDASAVLDALADSLGITLDRIDIDSEPDLRERYGHHVPVLCHGHTEICRHALDLPQLERYLAGQRDAANR